MVTVSPTGTPNYTYFRGNTPIHVGRHPDTVKEWCGYNPDLYKISAFLKGIYNDIYLGVITDLKARLQCPWLHHFIDEDAEAFLGDGFRHIEFGEAFPEEYFDVTQADESLEAVSGHPMNVVVEHHRIIFKWHIRIGHNRDTFATFFKDFAGFNAFMKYLKGYFTKALEKAVSLLCKAVLVSKPTGLVFDERDFARIFNKTGEQILPVTRDVRGTDVNYPATSKLGREFNKMMVKNLAKLYNFGSVLWKPIEFYNPYFYSFDDNFEEGNKMFVYQVGLKRNPVLADVSSSSGRGGTTSQPADMADFYMQQMYTDAHYTGILSERNQKTTKLFHLHRNDCLFALVDSISKVLNIMTTEPSSEFWLGNDSKDESNRQEGKKDIEAVKKQLQENLRDGILAGSPVVDPQDFANPSEAHTNTVTSENGFEVVADPAFLICFMNPEDHQDLDMGVARRGQMDVRAVNLDMLRKKVNNIYPMRGLPPGEVRIVDKRALRIKKFYTLFDVQTPKEKIHWRYKMFFQFALCIFQNFAGCYLQPTRHFIASPRFYNKYGLLGEKIIKIQGLSTNAGAGVGG